MRDKILWVKKHSGFISGSLIILFVIFFLALSNRGLYLTNRFIDPIRITNQRSEVVVVGIDDKSLQYFGAWPWKRDVFANLTKELDSLGAKIMVYDVLFLEEREGDNLFKESLKNVKTKVILGAKLDSTKYLTSHLLNDKTVSALANVKPDEDGKVRRYPVSFLNNVKCIYPLAESAFNFYTQNKNSKCNEISLGMFRYPKVINSYSVLDIISKNVSREKIKDKVIFVGSVSLDLPDHFVGMSGEKIPGVNVHASIFSSLLNKENDRNTTKTENFLVLLFYMLLTYYFIYKSKKLFWQMFGLLGISLSTLIVTVMFYSQGVVIPLPWCLGIVFASGGFMILYRFLKEQKKNEYIQSLFSKYVHKDVLEELMNSTSLRFDGEKRDMTILFSDLRGFTTFSETMTPEELTKLLNAYLSAMTPAILEEKGTIDKFIGDAIMAFWNAPLYVKDHSLHAVYAALRMEESLKKFNKEKGSKLAMGIGIHRGNVVVGNVGSEERVNYTVLGDAVNLASRIEGLTKKYGVTCLITDDVEKDIKDENIARRKLDVITVKGKNKPTILYEIKRMGHDTEKLFREYEKAYSHYENREFDLANRLFEKIMENDHPSKVLYERIKEVKDDPNFDGVWHFDEK